jgi:serine/threonine-protein kinase
MSEPAGRRLSAGTAIGSYVVEDTLGFGGFGAVYKARHAVTRKQVALKVLRAQLVAENPDVVTRFRREASVGNEIGHENIIEAFDFGEHEGQPYIAMELLEGSSLSDEVRRRGKMAADRAVAVLDQIADALSAAHRLGVVHRDLKPENVFLVRRRERADFVKILDFGIAKLVKAPDRLRTQTGQIFGSPDTMSPEQCKGGPLDHRSDIYSLGVVAFYILSGTFPFDGSAVEVMSSHLRDSPPRLRDRVPGIAAHLDELVARALAKRPEERYGSMDELRLALVDPTPADLYASGERTCVDPPRDLAAIAVPAAAEAFETAQTQARLTAHDPPRRRGARIALVALVGVLTFAGAVMVLRQPVREVPHVPFVPAPPERVRATLHVETEPDDAEVLVDGTAVAARPLRLERAVGQVLELRVQREGYRPVTRRVTVARDGQLVSVRLEPVSSAE